MQLDPTRWLVSFAGFTYDWIITREWTKILFGMFPIFVLIGGIVASWWGQTLDRRALAGWYMELGEAEIEDWETSWATAGSMSDDADDVEDQTGSTGDAENGTAESLASGSPEDSSAETVDDGNDPKAITPYAELLFQRVQQLEPSDRSQFIIGANLAQRGAIAESKDMLLELAPEDRSGYAPAHAFIALMYMREFQMGPTRELQNKLKHHVFEAKRWNRVPQELLRVGSDLYWTENPRDQATALKMLAQAAEEDPGLYLVLAKRARALKNKLVEEDSIPRAEEHFRELLAENPKDDVTRISLAEVYLAKEEIDESEALLKEGQELESTPKLTRALSELYRRRFRMSLKEKNGARSTQLLDIAMRYDPTNPGVVDDIAMLARFRGADASKEMIEQLQRFLAEGKATSATHAWLAEAYLVRENYAKALPHLEQVVTRLPNASKYLNNLAYILPELHPERMEDALLYAQRAVVSSKINNDLNADYYDTLATILAKLDRNSEAIAAFETAIQLKPRRKDFHARIADVYRKTNDNVMADNHMKVIAAIEKLEAEEAAAAAQAPADSLPAESPDEKTAELEDVSAGDVFGGESIEQSAAEASESDSPAAEDPSSNAGKKDDQ